jgi:hypothetical protein
MGSLINSGAVPQVVILSAAPCEIVILSAAPFDIVILHVLKLSFCPFEIVILSAAKNPPHFFRGATASLVGPNASAMGFTVTIQGNRPAPPASAKLCLQAPQNRAKCSNIPMHASPGRIRTTRIAPKSTQTPQP